MTLISSNLSLNGSFTRNTLLAAVLVLSSFIIICATSSSALADPHYTLTYNGRTYDGALDRSTFSYTLCWDGTPPQLSHFTVAVCAQLTPGALHSASPANGSLGLDASTGIYGVKWDPPASNNAGCDDYSYTLSGNYDEDPTHAAVAKAGSTNRSEFFTTTSASCDTPPNSSCGDGVLDAGEQCDDGNNVGGDGCSAVCIIEECGNGILDPGEGCDDGNLIDADRCDATCHSVFCGNGQIDNGESCDDGNVTNGDGCSEICINENCGDGNLDNGEECDDGNNVRGDGCNQLCVLEICGNGIVDSGEDCDDGNSDDTDACSNNCEGSSADSVNPLTPDGCNSVDITETQFRLDGGVKDQEVVIRLVLQRILRYAQNKISSPRKRQKVNAYVARQREFAHTTQITAWQTSWSIDSINFLCEFTPEFCISSSRNEEQMTLYKTLSTTLNKTLKKVLRKLNRLRGPNAQKVGRALRKRGRKLFKANIALANTVPGITAVCS